MALTIDEADIAGAEAFNRKLDRAPRFKIRSRLFAMFMQGLLRASQTRADARLRRQGLKVEDRRVSHGGTDVRVRIIRPQQRPRGVVLDIHGGGWVIGNARLDDQLNAGFALGCDAAVVSVDYSLATTAPIDAIMKECVAAAGWLLEAPEFEGLPIVIVGESAGGHLAAATLLGLKERGGLSSRLAGALFFYGVFDLAGSPSAAAAGPDTLVLHGPSLVDGLRRLTPDRSDEERRLPPLSPLYGDLQGMPPALMFVGELDPLLDDSLMMAERWGETAPVELHRLPASPHGFHRFDTSIASKVLAYSREWVGARLAERG